MKATLYVVPASHPSRTAALMLEHKRIGYRRIDLMPAVHKLALRAVGFRGDTVPALKIDGERVQTTREIARRLDQLVPDSPLFPADPEARAAVEAAEAFGDEELQPAVRRLAWWALKRNLAPLRSYGEGSHMGIPLGLAVKTAPPIAAFAVRYNEADDQHVQADLAAFPGWLDRIDAWVADGTLGGREANAADFQIATSLALAMTTDDLRPAIESRPAGRLARRIVPDYAGRMPAIFPAGWLEPLRATAAAS